MITVISYLVYLVITATVTVWVGTTLHKNGRAFLVDAFRGNIELAESVNHLLAVGFYLINFGYVSYVLKFNRSPEDLRTAIELLSHKLGVVLIVLGLMHFFNIYLFSKFRRSALLQSMQPPVQPNSVVVR